MAYGHRGDGPWLLFFLRSLVEQVRRLEVKVEREKLVLAALGATAGSPSTTTCSRC